MSTWPLHMATIGTLTPWSSPATDPLYLKHTHNGTVQMQNNYSHTSGYYSNTEEQDRSSTNSGSISVGGGGNSSGSTTSGGYGSPPPSGYFYDLQMYSNANTINTGGAGNPQLYQNVREVSYHHGHGNNISGHGNNAVTQLHALRHTPSPVRQVEKGGITFVDPFTPSQYSSSPPQYTSNTSNTSTYANPSPSNPQKVHVSTETVIQPVYATFGTESIFVTCPYCHHTDSTEIEQTVGSEALLWACIIPCFGFCRKSKWDTRHRCQNCLNVIGTHYP